MNATIEEYNRDIRIQNAWNRIRTVDQEKKLLEAKLADLNITDTQRAEYERLLGVFNSLGI